MYHDIYLHCRYETNIIAPVPAAIRMSILLEHIAAAEKQPIGPQIETESPTKCTNTALSLHIPAYQYLYNHCIPTY